jgi:hypothetical protein
MATSSLLVCGATEPSRAHGLQPRADALRGGIKVNRCHTDAPLKRALLTQSGERKSLRRGGTPQTHGRTRLMPAPQIAVISFDLAPNIEIATKLPTIEKGCQENSSDTALQLSSTGWRGTQGNRGLATLCRQRTTPRSVPNPLRFTRMSLASTE